VIFNLSAAVLSAFFPLFLNAAEGPVDGEEVVAAPFLSSCFENHPKFGRVPRPGCVTKLKPQWAEEAKEFKFNKLGLRDKDYAPKPDKDAIRILLLGPMFDGMNLSEEESASHKLEERLKLMGVKKVEVINGTVSGFYAPRSAEWAIKLIDDYSPDLIVYFQTGDAANSDLLESKALNSGGDASESYRGPEGPKSFGSDLKYLSQLWDLHSKARNSSEEAEKFLAPSLESFRKVLAHLQPNQRFIVFFSARPAEMALTIGKGGGFWISMMDHLTPKLQIPPAMIKTFLRETGVHAYPMSRGFRTPIQNELVFEQRPIALSAQGANAFAWNAAPWLRREIVAMNKTKVEETKTPTRPRHDRTRRRRQRRRQNN
jgi:hypothetical protein